MPFLLDIRRRIFQLPLKFIFLSSHHIIFFG